MSIIEMDILRQKQSLLKNGQSKQEKSFLIDIYHKIMIGESLKFPWEPGTSYNNILPTPFLASFRPNPSNQDRSYLRFDGLRQYGYVMCNTTRLYSLDAIKTN